MGLTLTDDCIYATYTSLISNGVIWDTPDFYRPYFYALFYSGEEMRSRVEIPDSTINFKSSDQTCFSLSFLHSYLPHRHILLFA